mmetsp:Transcript_12915/g.42248  ORF Transcript_12915/g.42248 Transcript_12915/m.42248 type:complete len:206 (+) Transcript_12915:540-1157(+)
MQIAWEISQRTEEDGEVDALRSGLACHQPKQVGPECHGLVVPSDETEFGTAVRVVKRVEAVDEDLGDSGAQTIQGRVQVGPRKFLGSGRVLQYRRKCLRQDGQVDRERLRLPSKRVVEAPAHPRAEDWVESLHEAEGAVVQSDAAQGRVVRVEVALTVTDSHPLSDQSGLALANLPKHVDEQVGEGSRWGLQPQVGKVAPERMLG